MAYWLDDGFDSWPEVARAGTAAVGLYARCGTWLARNIANGRIDDAIVPSEIADSYGTAEWRQRLVDVGLWAIDRMGYRDLRHFDLNPTAKKVRENHRRKVEAGRKGGLARANTSKQEPSRRQARARAPANGLLQPPSLPPPSTKGEGDARHASLGGARVPTNDPPWPDEDPTVIAAENERLRQLAEARTHQLAVEQARARNGAAAARAALNRQETP